MIEIDASLPDITRDLLVAVRALLLEELETLDLVAAGTNVSQRSEPYRFEFPADAGMKAEPCHLWFPALDGEHAITTDFSRGRILLACLLTLPIAKRVSEVARTADFATVLKCFNLAPQNYAKADIPTEADVTFVAPIADGFVYGYCDTYPPATIISSSRYPAAPAIHLALEQAATGADLHARIAEFLPD